MLKRKYRQGHKTDVSLHSHYTAWSINVHSTNVNITISIKICIFLVTMQRFCTMKCHTTVQS